MTAAPDDLILGLDRADKKADLCLLETANGLRWRRVADPQFLFPQAKLAARFKGRLQAWLKREHPEQGTTLPAKVWWVKWVADVQPVGSGEAALKYACASREPQPEILSTTLERKINELWTSTKYF